MRQLFRKPIVIISLGMFIILSGVIIAADRANIPETTAEVRALAVRTTLAGGKAIPPGDFVFDGCTLFPERLLGLDLTRACLEHDIAYWAGGTTEERRAADIVFKAAVAEAGRAGTILAPLAYTGVHLFGDTWLTKIFDANWGFGWNNHHD